MSQVDLVKVNYGRQSYTQTIDTSFSQLGGVTSSLEQSPLPTVDEFFQDYNALFFSIPKTGENSHTSLIESSTQYLGFSPDSIEIQALQQEITFLREQLLETRQQIEAMSNSSTGSLLSTL